MVKPSNSAANRVFWNGNILGGYIQKLRAACKLVPVTIDEEAEKKTKHWAGNINAKNIVKTHLEKSVLFCNYVINNNIGGFIAAGVIAEVSREVTGAVYDSEVWC